MKNNITLWIMGFMGFIILLCVASIPSENTHRTKPIDSTNPDYGVASTVETKPDWTLSIPDIDFEQQMTQIIRQGSTLPVPDSDPGYYSETEGNLFIVGHNGSVFNRLNELPKTIYIYQNNSPDAYSLVTHQTLPVDQINMDSLLNYQGVVLMTCAGEKTDGVYSHRLILYFRS